MSRAQEGQVVDTSGKQNTTFNQNAQTSFENANKSIDAQQGDIGAYQEQLSKFAGANPYGRGGVYQTSINQATSDTADAASQSATQAGQSAAVRTGQNSTAAVAAGTAASLANTRALMAEQARNNATRIDKGAGYGAQVLSASSVPATLQSSITGDQSRLAETEAGAGNTALSIDEKASEEPSLMDTAGNAFVSNFAGSLGKWAGGGK